jgi:hypothetical protein
MMFILGFVCGFVLLGVRVSYMIYKTATSSEPKWESKRVQLEEAMQAAREIKED